MENEFFRAIFKGLDGKIEVREIGITKKENRRYFFKSVDELEKYNPDQDKNVYFGIYTRLGRSGKAENCITTKALWADFDYVTEGQARKIIHDSALPEATIIISSGNGIHAYWILKERAANEAIDILKAICMRSGSDTKVAEKARILRMPGTNNIKGKVKKCEIIEINDNEYKIEEFKEILKNELNHIQNVKELTGIKEEVNEFKNCSKACVKFMSQGTIEGHRNFALCKLAKWLQLKGYSRKAALDVIRRWNTLNTPPIPYKRVLIEFNKVWETDYKMLGCKFKNKDLQLQSDYFCSLGECKHSAFQEIEEITSDNSSKIDNIIFKDETFSEIKGVELAIYFTIAKTEGITREHLAKIIGIDKKNRNFISAIEHLNKMELIKVIEGNRRVKEKDLLILSNLYNDGRGYTIINNLLSEAFLGNRITDTQYKLLILLKSFSYTDTTIYPTVSTLAVKMGKTDRTITSILKQLQQKLYIKNTYTRRDDGRTKIYIKLLF